MNNVCLIIIMTTLTIDCSNNCNITILEGGRETLSVGGGEERELMLQPPQEVNMSNLKLKKKIQESMSFFNMVGNSRGGKS